MIVDAEQIVGDYLRTHAAVVALDANVSATRKADATRPWVRYTLLDAPSRAGRTDHLIEYMIQFDCFPAKGEEGIGEAALLHRTVREALRTMPDADLEATVNGVEFIGDARQLDTAVEPARPFYALTTLIWMHANGGGS